MKYRVLLNNKFGEGWEAGDIINMDENSAKTRLDLGHIEKYNGKKEPGEFDSNGIKEVIDETIKNPKMYVDKKSLCREVTIKEAAIGNLESADKILKNLKIKYWLTLGTCLGAYRDEDFCEKDEVDIDLGLDIKYYSQRSDIKKAFKKEGFIIYNEWKPKDKIAPEISFIRKFKGIHMKVDLFFYTNVKGNMLWRFYRDLEAKQYSTRANNPKYFKSLSKIKFYSKEYNVPSNTEDYLKDNYGENWRTPIGRKDWNYMTDNSSPEMNSEITFIIKSFGRTECIGNLIKSIRKYYDIEPIIVCDDSKGELNFREFKNTFIMNTEFDIGLSEGRNRMIKKVRTPYFVLLDDDFEFTKETDIYKLLKKAKTGDYDIVSGAIMNNGKIDNYEGRMSFKNGILSQKACKKEPYDYVFNFFVGKTETFIKCKWDKALKMAEHTAFFWKHKGKLKIGYEPKVIVEHKQKKDVEYNKFRGRASRIFIPLFLKKYGIKKFINQQGVEYKIDKVKMYE